MSVVESNERCREANATDSSPVRLLVADDEHLVAAGLKANLEELGFEVVALAADGDQAIEACREHRPDLALLDIRMPGRDGLDAAKVIFRRMGVPAMMLSAYSDSDYVKHANLAGVFGFLLKPISLDQLRAGIGIAWGRYREQLAMNDEIAGLKQRLEDRKIIEQAKWIIVKRKEVSEPEAMKVLQRHARNTRRTLADVARSMIENEDLLGGV